MQKCTPLYNHVDCVQIFQDPFLARLKLCKNGGKIDICTHKPRLRSMRPGLDLNILDFCDERQSTINSIGMSAQGKLDQRAHAVDVGSVHGDGLNRMVPTPDCEMTSDGTCMHYVTEETVRQFCLKEDENIFKMLKFRTSTFTRFGCVWCCRYFLKFFTKPVRHVRKRTFQGFSRLSPLHVYLEARLMLRVCHGHASELTPLVCFG